MGKKGGRDRKGGERYPSGDRKRTVGGEPIAPALWGRIKREHVKLGLDPRLASEVGRLALHAELTNTQAAAAFKVGEIYGRYERLKGKRRTTASPSYQSGMRGEAGIAEELMTKPELARLEENIRCAEEGFFALVGRDGKGGEIPWRARGPIEDLCVEDRPINPTLLPDMRALLDHLARHFGVSGRAGSDRPTTKKRGVAATLPIAIATRPNIDRIWWIEVLKRLHPTWTTEQCAKVYDTQQALKARAVFRLGKARRPVLVSNR